MCCWHCRYYVRPVERFQIDGPLGNVCTVEQAGGGDTVPESLYKDGKLTDPDFYCDQFEMDIPTVIDG